MDHVRSAMEAAQGEAPFDNGVRVLHPNLLDLTTGPGWIYFIVPARMNTVKIGWALNPVERLKTLQTAHHAVLKIFAVIPDTQDAEYRLHRMFADSRIRGEWFDWTALRARVEALAGAKGYLVNNAPNGRKSRNSPEAIEPTRYLRVILRA